MTDTWSDTDADTAATEGWGLFDCHGSDWTDLQLQKIDDPDYGGRFTDEADAWMHVRRQADQGSDLHARALEHLAHNAWPEWHLVMSWRPDTDPTAPNPTEIKETTP